MSAGNCLSYALPWSPHSRHTGLFTFLECTQHASAPGPSQQLSLGLKHSPPLISGSMPYSIQGPAPVHSSVRPPRTSSLKPVSSLPSVPLTCFSVLLKIDYNLNIVYLLISMHIICLHQIAWFDFVQGFSPGTWKSV